MKKVVHKLRQEVKVKVDVVTSDDIKIYYIPVIFLAQIRNPVSAIHFSTYLELEK